MCRIILIVLLTVVTSSCNKSPGWSKVGGDRNYTLYVDQPIMAKNGDRVKIWTMYDFNNPQTIEVLPGKSMVVLSRKLQSEYDCKARKTQLLNIIAYSENMAKGENTTINVIPGFISVAPATISEDLLKIACGEMSL